MPLATVAKIYRTATDKSMKKTALGHIPEMRWPGGGKNEITSESELKQIMFDRGCSRGARGWKTGLSDLYKANRVQFCTKYRHFDWVKSGLSSDEAKTRRAELSKCKVWKLPGEELDLNVIGSKRVGV